MLVAAALAVSVLMTWPLASGMGHLGRTQNSGDGRFAVWNVAWVAHALTTSPADLFDANIFYPHRRALAFSEANIGAGTLAVPIWAATHNPFAAHNSVVLMAFSASVIFTWLLVRRLTGDGGAAATASILFAFCPYVFAHTAHIQLLMVAGIPLSLLAFHRLVDAPSPQRGVALGLALAAQAMSCAYYGVSVGLTVGYATLFYAWSRRLWTTTRYWIAIAIAAASSLVIVVPFFLPFLAIQEETGFARSLDDARQWSAYVRSYLASGSHAHAWLLPLIRDWNAAVLFPGFLSIGLGLAGAAIALREPSVPAATLRLSRDRETAMLYGSIAILTFWASLGPRAGLYSLFYATIPIFSFLRAPERMGIVVMLCLAVLAAFAIRELCRRFPARRRAIAIIACAAAILELNDLPFDWRSDSVRSTYRVLAAHAARTGGRIPLLRSPNRFSHPHAVHAQFDRALAAAAERLQRSHPRRLSRAGAGSGDVSLTRQLQRVEGASGALPDAQPRPPGLRRRGMAGHRAAAAAVSAAPQGRGR